MSTDRDNTNPVIKKSVNLLVNEELFFIPECHIFLIIKLITEAVTVPPKIIQTLKMYKMPLNLK